MNTTEQGPAFLCEWWDDREDAVRVTVEGSTWEATACVRQEGGRPIITTLDIQPSSASGQLARVDAKALREVPTAVICAVAGNWRWDQQKRDLEGMRKPRDIRQDIFMMVQSAYISREDADAIKALIDSRVRTPREVR